MDDKTRRLIEDMREELLEWLYCEPKYSRSGHELAKLIHRADVALGGGYGDIRKRYPGPRKAATKRTRVAA